MPILTKSDLPKSQLTNFNRYNELYLQPTLSPSEQTEFDNLAATPLAPYIFKAADANTLNTDIVNHIASVATSATPSHVKPDNSTIVVNGSGTISATPATSSTFGVVKPDNSTIFISNGIISATPTVWELIATYTVGATPASQVDFASISSSYKFLKVMFVCESSTSTTRNLLVRLNDAASSAYTYIKNKLVAASNTASGAAGDTSIVLTEALIGNTEDYSCTGEITFMNVRPNVNDRLTGFFSYAGFISASFLYTGGWTYGSNITINKLSLIASADAIATGSYFVLMGVK